MLYVSKPNTDRKASKTMDAVELQRWLGVVFVIGCVLLSYPIMTIYSVPATVGGIPVLYLVLFGIWIGLIAATALLMRHVAPSPPADE